MKIEIFLFPKTIVCMRERLAILRERFGKISFKGASTRIQNPERVSTFQDIVMLQQLLGRAIELPKPKQTEIVEVGHCVDTKDSIAGTGRFHICSELDVKYLKGLSPDMGRLLSVESELGRLLCGKRIGTEIKCGGKEYTIERIGLSPLLLGSGEGLTGD